MPYKVHLCELDKGSSSSSKIDFRLVDHNLRNYTWADLGKWELGQFSLAGYGLLVKDREGTDSLLVAMGNLERAGCSHLNALANYSITNSRTAGFRCFLT